MSAVGPNLPYEAVIFATVDDDADGALKVRQIEEFVDSKVYAG